MDHIVSVAGVEQVGVAIGGTEHGVVARAAVDGFAEIGAIERFGRIGPDQVNILGVEIGQRHDAVGKDELFYGVRLAGHPASVVLPLNEQCLASVLDRQHQGRAITREGDIVQRDPAQLYRVEPGLQQHMVALIPDGVVAVAAHPDVGVVVDAAFEPVIARATIQRVVQVKPVNRVVAIGTGLIEVLFRETQHVPLCAIPELDQIDGIRVEIAQNDRRGQDEFVQELDLVVGALNAEGHGAAAAHPFKGEIRDAVAKDLQRIEGACEVIPLVILDDIKAIADAPMISVVLIATGQHVIACAAVQFILVMKAVDDVRAVGLGLLQDAGHDLLLIHVGLIVEHKTFDPVLPVETENPGVHRLELIDDCDRLTGLDPVIVQHPHFEVVAVAVADQADLVLGQTLGEVQDVVVIDQQGVVVILDDVDAVAFVNDVGVAVTPAAHDVIAQPAFEHVDGRGAQHEVIGVERM